MGTNQNQSFMNRNRLLGVSILLILVAIDIFPALRSAYFRRRREKKRRQSRMPQIPLAKVQDKRYKEGAYILFCETYDECFELRKVAVRVDKDQYRRIDRQHLVGLRETFCAFSGDKKIPGYEVITEERKPVFSPTTS